MVIYFAPLEGVTDVVYRRTHHACFGGVTKYFIPFLSPTQTLTFTSKEQKAVSPVENAGIPVVPQILTKHAEHFLWMANILHDVGYNEVNLNLGCPSGTVTAKGKGSGMLRDLPALEQFLDEVYAKSPVAISIKTRIGFESVEEWPKLLSLFVRYPIHELIVHPRTRREFYAGRAHRELCEPVVKETSLPFVYNGDLFTVDDCRTLQQMYPGAIALMLGRGLIANPALARELQGGAPLTRSELRDFHDRLYNSYLEFWPKNHLVGHMNEIMSYMVRCFANANKPRKAIRKATNLDVYCDAVNRLFNEFELLETPSFLGEDL